MRGNLQFGVWRQNVAALEAFMAVATQWRRSPMSDRVTGLDYQGVQAALDMMGIEDKQKMFNDIRIMESALLEEVRNGR